MGLFLLVEHHPTNIPADSTYWQKRIDAGNDCQIRKSEVFFTTGVYKKPRTVAAVEVMASADQGRISRYILQGAPGSCKSRAFYYLIKDN